MIRIVPAEEIKEVSERLSTSIYTISYADVKEVEAALKKFISQRGSLSSNLGTSNIIVTDVESRVKEIDKFIKVIDRITPQILVEARIYDITSKDRLDLGIQWEIGRNTPYYTETATGGTNPALSGTGTLGANPGNRNYPFMKSVFNSLTSETEGIGLLRFGWLDEHFDIDARLKAQQNIINATLLANPRILVLDNETAYIKIITEKPYIELTETSAGGSMGTTNFREIGVELQVTPHVTREEMIRLQLMPKFSVETGTVNVGATGAVQYPQPVVDRREANTTLLVKDNQTVVLGGLRKKEVNTQVNKVPFLGDLPVVGLLFKCEGEDTVISELVVFITPKIVVNPALSPKQVKQYEVTDFEGPEPAVTKADKKASEEASEEVAEEISEDVSESVSEEVSEEISEGVS